MRYKSWLLSVPAIINFLLALGFYGVAQVPYMLNLNMYYGGVILTVIAALGWISVITGLLICIWNFFARNKRDELILGGIYLFISGALSGCIYSNLAMMYLGCYESLRQGSSAGCI
jgi:hypothetical protein